MISLINTRTDRGGKRLYGYRKKRVAVYNPQLAKKQKNENQQTDRKSKNPPGRSGKKIRIRGQRKICDLSGR